ncbi:unnamed protein product [Penicillium salamii]|uniref:Uncharacterized protein n=1 Tax=Penicillium salamii TaxID=1612424 RepID=A0A9W4IT15_9EURO|nr:unnamed protein product [Penicillium salamii]CAG7996619.1 unnamed protein product [Penicillium salamii]CAG8163800.1 unnamed protein product [Penicillium salamii]CAG8194034.1 unnamed protein product [Penicillium salamii]CAG8225201.1 unnamed protein product [Penicillium salamii]
MDELRHSLLTYPDWGFVIYRTTYSAESDTLFPDAIRFIEGCIKEEFFAEADRCTPNEPSEIWAKHRSTIVQDPAQFDGASLETIRAHFETWVEAQSLRDSWTKWRMCMIIDEESLQTLKDAPIEALEDGTLDDTDKDLRYVKVLEAFPTMDKYDTFPGWMKCWPYVLFDLWSMMGDGDEMRGSFCRIEDPDDDEDFPFPGVYCG